MKDITKMTDVEFINYLDIELTNRNNEGLVNEFRQYLNTYPTRSRKLLKVFNYLSRRHNELILKNLHNEISEIYKSVRIIDAKVVYENESGETCVDWEYNNNNVFTVKGKNGTKDIDLSYLFNNEVDLDKDISDLHYLIKQAKDEVN